MVILPDGAGLSFQKKNVSSWTCSVTTTKPYNVLVAFVVTTGSTAFRDSVVSGAGLVWQLRARLHVNTSNHSVMEIWTAIAPAVLTNAIITATLTGSSFSNNLAIKGFTGVDLNNIWDSNAPVTAVNLTATNSSAHVSLSTSNAANAVLGFMATEIGVGGIGPTPGVGYTDAFYQGWSNTQTFEYKLVSALQSGLLVDALPAVHQWGFIGDSLRAAPGPTAALTSLELADIFAANGDLRAYAIANLNEASDAFAGHGDFRALVIAALMEPSDKWVALGGTWNYDGGPLLSVEEADICKITGTVCYPPGRRYTRYVRYLNYIRHSRGRP